MGTAELTGSVSKRLGPQRRFVKVVALLVILLAVSSQVIIMRSASQARKLVEVTEMAKTNRAQRSQHFNRTNHTILDAKLRKQYPMRIRPVPIELHTERGDNPRSFETSSNNDIDQELDEKLTSADRFLYPIMKKDASSSDRISAFMAAAVFAKALNRTLVVPVFQAGNNVIDFRRIVDRNSTNSVRMISNAALNRLSQETGASSASHAIVLCGRSSRSLETLKNHNEMFPSFDRVASSVVSFGKSASSDPADFKTALEANEIHHHKLITLVDPLAGLNLGSPDWREIYAPLRTRLRFARRYERLVAAALHNIRAVNGPFMAMGLSQALLDGELGGGTDRVLPLVQTYADKYGIRTLYLSVPAQHDPALERIRKEFAGTVITFPEVGISSRGIEKLGEFGSFLVDIMIMERSNLFLKGDSSERSSLVTDGRRMYEFPTIYLRTGTVPTSLAGRRERQIDVETNLRLAETRFPDS